MTPDSEAVTFTHFRCQSCGYTGVISAQEIEEHRSRCAFGTTEPLQAAPEAPADPAIPDDLRAAYESYAVWDGRMMVDFAKARGINLPWEHDPHVLVRRSLIERIARAEATIAELVGALQSLVDSIEDAGGHDENGDVFDITEACAAIDRAKEASR